MWFLKFILCIILTIFLGWSTLLFSGPSIVKFFANKYFGDELVIDNIKMSPKLHMTIGEISFKRLDTSNEAILDITARGISISWSISSKEPVLYVSIGPTTFEGMLGFDSALFDFSFENVFSWENFKATATAKLNDLTGLGNVAELDLSWHTKRNFAVLENVNFSTPNIFMKAPFHTSLQSVRGYVDSIDLNKSVFEQSNASSVWLDKIVGFDDQYFIKNTGIEITNNFGRFGLDLTAPAMYGADDNWEIYRVKLVANFLTDNRIEFENINFKIGEFISRVPVTNISSLEGAIVSENNRYVTNVSGMLEDIVFKTGELTVMQLKDGSFEIDAEINRNTLGPDVDGIFELSLSVEPNIVFEGGYELFLLGEEFFAACAQLECLVQAMKIDYKIKVGLERLYGVAFCPSIPCRKPESSFKVTSSNTQSLFNNLIASKLFNPIALAIIYNTFQSGKRLGLGHEVIF